MSKGTYNLFTIHVYSIEYMDIMFHWFDFLTLDKKLPSKIEKN